MQLQDSINNIKIWWLCFDLSLIFNLNEKTRYKQFWNKIILWIKQVCHKICKLIFKITLLLFNFHDDVIFLITFTLHTIKYVEIISGIVCLKKLYWHKILSKQIKRKLHIFPIFANFLTWEKKPWIYGLCTDNSTIITSYCTKF